MVQPSRGIPPNIDKSLSSGGFTGLQSTVSRHVQTNEIGQEERNGEHCMEFHLSVCTEYYLCIRPTTVHTGRAKLAVVLVASGIEIPFWITTTCVDVNTNNPPGNPVVQLQTPNCHNSLAAGRQMNCSHLQIGSAGFLWTLRTDGPIATECDPDLFGPRNLTRLLHRKMKKINNERGISPALRSFNSTLSLVRK